jgi:hypothetical protein
MIKVDKQIYTTKEGEYVFDNDIRAHQLVACKGSEISEELHKQIFGNHSIFSAVQIPAGYRETDDPSEATHVLDWDDSIVDKTGSYSRSLKAWMIKEDKSIKPEAPITNKAIKPMTNKILDWFKISVTI